MAAMITEVELNTFTGNFETNVLKTTVIDAADRVVRDFLGYSPEQTDFTYRFTGTGYDYCALPVPGASVIKSITIDGTTFSSSNYSLDATENKVLLNTGYYFTRDAKIVIVYTAGYSSIPAAMKHSCLRIAALMFEEMHGNIGVTSKQFADLSKNFISYTNYNKYLNPLSRYRLGGV